MCVLKLNEIVWYIQINPVIRVDGMTFSIFHWMSHFVIGIEKLQFVNLIRLLLKCKEKRVKKMAEG